MRADFKLPSPSPMAATSTAQVSGINQVPSPATGYGRTRKTKNVAGSGTVGSPKQAKVKPPRVRGYYWRNDGSGWQLRKSGRDGDPDKNRYVASLSLSEFEKMKSRHPTPTALDDALARWVTRKIEKGGDNE